MQKTKRNMLAGLMAVAAASTLGLGATSIAPLAPAVAHEADCPECEMAIVEKEEVQMKVGQKTIDYRCVLCAIAQAKGEYPKSNVTISAPSEKSTRIIVKRVAGKWSASPASAVFLKAPVKHRQCHVGYHAFTSKAALANWAKQKGYPNKPLTLAQMVAVSN
jgi:hypothetical protein